MQILTAHADDAEALTDLHLDVWEEAYTGLVPAQVLAERRSNRARRVHLWREIIASGSSTVLVARQDHGDRLLGFVSAGPGRDEPGGGLPALEVKALYVRADVYARGLGHALLDAAIGSAPAYLWVLDGNQRAVRFYERQGFCFDGRSKTEDVGVERRMVRKAP